MVNLLFGFEGRISRTQFWIGVLIIITAEVALMLIFGIPFFPTEMQPVRMRLVEFAIELVTVYPTAAITVKRLHDRNQPAYYAAWLVGPIMIVSFIDLFGVRDPKHVSWLDGLLGFCLVGILLVFLVELGFRRGTIGENQYGPDPLGDHPAGAPPSPPR